LIFAGLALSVDLLLGYTGALSLGQALYFGIGAYVSALVLLQTASFWLALYAAGGASLLSAFIGGLIANRVRAVYFTLITLGLSQVVGKIIYNTRELGASDGIIGIPVIDIGIGSWSREVVGSNTPPPILHIILPPLAAISITPLQAPSALDYQTVKISFCM
jgi:branched-chain amino acid transport system permease protein